MLAPAVPSAAPPSPAHALAAGRARWRPLDVAVLLALAALLVWPLHVPYQVPDQDWPSQWAILELIRGGWAPWYFQYTSAFTNLLRLGYGGALGAARLLGHPLDAIDLLGWSLADPALFRIPPRAVGMAAGVLALLAARRLAAGVAGRGAGLAAAVLLGTAPGFVREHHQGMFDAPAAGAAAWVLALAGSYVLRPRPATLLAAGALAGLAVSLKQTTAVMTAAVPVAALVARAPWRARLATLAGAGATAAVVLVATSPGLVLDTGRFLAHQHLIRAALYAEHPAFTGDGVLTVLGRALGEPLLAVALLGTALAAWRGERGLAPAAAVALVGTVLAFRSALVLNRYALPLAMPIAVLAAYGIHALVRRTGARVAVTAALVALALPVTLGYLRLLGREDTRVAAARWVTAHVRPGARLVWPGTPVHGVYVGPDLARSPGLERGLAPDVRRALEARLGDRLPGGRRYAPAIRPRPGCDPCPDLLRPLAGTVVMTAEHPEPQFAAGMSSPALVAALDAYAVRLADWPIVRAPGHRVYERGDYNFVPVAGASTLARPGPHLGVWWVPPLPGPAAPPPVDAAVLPPGAAARRLGGAAGTLAPPARPG